MRATGICRSKMREMVTSKRELAISSRDTGRRIPCFETCQLTIDVPHRDVCYKLGGV